MAGRDNHNTNQSFDRRKFISNTIKLAALGSVLVPLEQACRNKSQQKDKQSGQTIGKKTVDQKNSHLHTTKHHRTKWHHEGLLINQKTNVAHLPTATTYVFYDEIKADHMQELNLNNWENQVQGKIHFNKDKSGNILEALSLQKLKNDVNNDSLTAATNTLSKAFSKDCDNKKGQNRNTTNYRLHELMLQLIALNATIPAESKWQAFNNKIRKPQKSGKRCKWMETESAFNDRVKYITDRQEDYKKRLNKRALKYALT
jgi:hypothetical protein